MLSSAKQWASRPFVRSLIVVGAIIALSWFGIYSFTTSFFGAQRMALRQGGEDNNNATRFGFNNNQTTYKKVVIMLVDALRADMVLDGNMPDVKSHLLKGESLGFRGIAETPTVTMPRIKAMTTGTVPSFLDVINNFASSALNEDNILSILQKEHNKKIVFYGDNTWLKLFPGHFHRFEGTTSFFTKDFFEVDDNVTRHIDGEFSGDRNDWDLLILHYLGLDHIGHQLGSSGSVMNAKQKEMNDIYMKIYLNLKKQKFVEQQNNANDSFLLILCSDHGMTKIGTHGGSSIDESSAVLVFTPIGASYNYTNAQSPSKQEMLPTVRQIDLVPTLSLLMGSSIPNNSIGKVIRKVFPRKLQIPAMYANIRQILSMLNRAKGHSLSFRNSLRHCEHALTVYRSFEQRYNFPNDFLNVNSDSQNIPLFDLKDNEVNHLFKVFSDCVTVAQDQLVAQANPSKDVHLFVAPLFCLLGAFVASLMFFHSNKYSKLFFRPKLTAECCLLAGGCIGTIILSTSSSFVENEFAWFQFLCATWVMLRIRTVVGRSIFQASVSGQSTAQTNVLLSDLFKLMWIIVALRIISQRNSIINFVLINNTTKRELIPGSSIVSSLPHRIWHHCSVFLICIGGFHLLSSFLKKSAKHGNTESIWKTYCNKYLYFQVAILAAGFFVCMYGKIIEDRENTIPQFVYACSLAALLLGFTNFYTRNNDAKVLRKTLDGFLSTSVISSFSLLCLNLHRWHNCAFVILLIILLNFFVALQLEEKRERFALVTHGKNNVIIRNLIVMEWIGKCFFYALGNSHLVATIDIAGAYNGLSSYNPFVCGSLVWILVETAPLMTMLVALSMYEHDVRKAKTTISGGCVFVVSLCSIEMLVRSVILLAMQNHLFIWTVFAPKFFYEVSKTLVRSLCVIISILLAGFQIK